MVSHKIRLTYDFAFSLLKKNDPFFSDDLIIIQLGVVNKILKDLIYKNAIDKAHRFFAPFLKGWNILYLL